MKYSQPLPLACSIRWTPGDMSSGERPGFSDAGPRKPATPQKHDYLGHRERARARFNKAGGEALADYELLELLLHVIIPQKDTKSLAKQLLERFGSFSEVLAAPRKQLMEIKGLGDITVTHLKVIMASAQRLTTDAVRDKPILGSWSELLDYCRAHMAFEEVEQFRILFLDKKNKLLKDEVQQVGTVDHTPVYPREVIKRALELNATALILAHNHPSGDPQPSSADLQMTRAIIDIAVPLGITVHDHIIMGRNGHVSMKARKLI